MTDRGRIGPSATLEQARLSLVTPEQCPRLSSEERKRSDLKGQSEASSTVDVDLARGQEGFSLRTHLSL